MLSNHEWRELLGRHDMTDAEVKAFVDHLRAYLGQVLDAYFRDEFRDDPL